MEQKINIAELLKDCPKGMELYSPIFGKVYLDKIRPHLAIVVVTDKEQGDFREEFLYDGRYGMNGECMLFPSKDKTTWEGFQRPFVDGDIVVTTLDNIAIIKKSIVKELSYVYYAYMIMVGNYFYINETATVAVKRLATEEEKQKLFDAIKAKGYKWNAETKTLEMSRELRFKVGDRIKYRSGEIVYRVIKITEDSYLLDNLCSIPISIEHMYNLVPDKFDITTLKPFDKVLVRDNNEQMWTVDFFSFYDEKTIHFHV